MSENRGKSEREARLEAEIAAARGVVTRQPEQTSKGTTGEASEDTYKREGHWSWGWLLHPWRSQRMVRGGPGL
ncbi:hypothetical protein [Thiohalorhabdus methylotrophus]|uniref:Uncharacterized protein n=1 Tax=Thiohalorhabdus methylotrophus TaxID=3242694 RepID=A0ABV4TVA2_9GAMM